MILIKILLSMTPISEYGLSNVELYTLTTNEYWELTKKLLKSKLFLYSGTLKHFKFGLQSTESVLLNFSEQILETGLYE